MTVSPQIPLSNFSLISWENCYDEEIIDHGDINSRLLTPPPWNLPQSHCKYLGRSRFQPIFARYRSDSANIVIKLVEERLFIKTIQFILENNKTNSETSSFSLSPDKLNKDDLYNILSEGHTLLVYDLTHQKVLGVLIARIHNSGLCNIAFTPKNIHTISNSMSNMKDGFVFPEDLKRGDSEKIKTGKERNNIISWMQKNYKSYSQKSPLSQKASRYKKFTPESLTKFIPCIHHVSSRNKQVIHQKQEIINTNSKTLRFSTFLDTTDLEKLQVGQKVASKELINSSSNRKHQSILKVGSYDNQLNIDRSKTENQMDGTTHTYNANYLCTIHSGQTNATSNSISLNVSNKDWLYEKLFETNNGVVQVKQSYILSLDGRRNVGNITHNVVRKNQLFSKRKDISEIRMKDDKEDDIKFERDTNKEKINKRFYVAKKYKKPNIQSNQFKVEENNEEMTKQNISNQHHYTQNNINEENVLNKKKNTTRLGNRKNKLIKPIKKEQSSNNYTDKSYWKYMTNLVFDEDDDVEISYLEPKIFHTNLSVKEISSILQHEPYSQDARSKTLSSTEDYKLHTNVRLFQDLGIQKYLNIHLLTIDSEWNQPDIFTYGLMNGLVQWAKFINPAENLDAIIAIPNDDLYSGLYDALGFKIIKKLNKLEYIDDEDKNTSYEENIVENGKLTDERYCYINIIGENALSYWNYIGKY